MPYASILSASSRDSLGIDLKNTIILFDEAHNLAEQFSSLNSIKITYNELCECFLQVKKYLFIYNTRLKPKTKFYLKKIVDFLKSFLTIFNEGQTIGLEKELMDPIKLLSDLNCIEFDLFELSNFLTKSQVSRKMVNFTLKEGKADEFANT